MSITNSAVVAIRNRWRTGLREHKAEQAAADQRQFTPRNMSEYPQWARRNDRDAYVEHAAQTDETLIDSETENFQRR